MQKKLVENIRFPVAGKWHLLESLYFQGVQGDAIVFDYRFDYLMRSESNFSIFCLADSSFFAVKCA